jgi:4-alpha-glucanotransferase
MTLAHRSLGGGGRFHCGRHAGVLIPLFSIPSRRSWGIGEIPDLAHLAAWVARAGLDFVQVLPINDMDEAHNSPYAARSGMAIDPLFISLAALPDFQAAGGEALLPADARDALAAARHAPTVDYQAVRVAKTAALQSSFSSFDGRVSRTDPASALAFDAFLAREAPWLDDYALFRALHDESGGRYWQEWDDGIRGRSEPALSAARVRLAERIRYHAYVQWVAADQWNRLRPDGGSVGIFGDLPFMVSGHSADVWSRQDEFRLDASIGVPPDPVSLEEQDWGLPAPRWDVSAANGFAWQRQRSERCADLFDGFRVDHLVGFYRTCVRERDATWSLEPPRKTDQRRQGEALLRIFSSAGAMVYAEDLGTVPDFVRESMTGLGIPGMKVLRWERLWDEPVQPFRDPSTFPAASVATTGTHDTETLAGWWDAADAEERRQCAGTATMQAAGLRPDAPFSAEVRDALLRGLFAAGSDVAILPIQDVFGWRDRINDPAAAATANWGWRLPWPVEDLVAEPAAVERAAFLRAIVPGR